MSKKAEYQKIIEEYERMKEELVSYQTESNELLPVIDELKKDPNVIKFIEINTRLKCVNSEIKRLSSKISEQDMMYCNHYFVIQRDNGGYDGHRYERDYEVTCIHCGLTNKYMNFYGNEFNEYQRKMNHIYVHYNHNAQTYGWASEKELPVLKEIVDKFTDEYPDASNKDIENHVELVKKMKGGKLC